MFRNIGLAGSVLIWISCVPVLFAQQNVPTNPVVDPADALSRGQELLTAGDLKAARASFVSVPESSADYFHALSNLGILERKQGHLEAAIRYFEESMDQFEVWRQLRLDQVRKQIRVVRKELAKIPIQQEEVVGIDETGTEGGVEATASETDRVQILTDRLGQLEEQFIRYQQMPYPARYSFEFGNTLFDALAFQRALDLYAATVKGNPEFGPAYVKLSVCYFLFNNCDRARWAYDRAVALEQEIPRQFEEDLMARCGD